MCLNAATDRQGTQTVNNPFHRIARLVGSVFNGYFDTQIQLYITPLEKYNTCIFLFIKVKACN